jgi:ubiquitin-protein ligase
MAELLTSVTGRRLVHEWREAQHLASCNTDVIRVEPPRPDGPDTAIPLVLRRTYALVRSPAAGLHLGDEHAVVLKLPRFFPAVPIEAYLDVPVFHPNVDPVNGFVCLWDRYSPGDTLVDTVLRLQRILSWNMVNLFADHVMQPAAAAWYQAGAEGFRLPLSYPELHLPEGLGGLEIASPSSNYQRRRLA